MIFHRVRSAFQNPSRLLRERLALLGATGLMASTLHAYPSIPNFEAKPTEALAQEAPVATDRARELLVSALGFVGLRYKRGGTTPQTGFDCSGLVHWVYEHALGFDLPRRAEEMARIGETVRRDELTPGDLVFFNTLKRAFSHVGIYIGDGKFVHAPSTGGQVRIEALDSDYWRQRWNGARRLARDEPGLLPARDTKTPSL